MSLTASVLGILFIILLASVAVDRIRGINKNPHHD